MLIIALREVQAQLKALEESMQAVGIRTHPSGVYKEVALS